MVLKIDSIIWALDFLCNHSDGDLFPKLPEMDVINNDAESFAKVLSSKPLAELIPGACRRFIVPKDEVSYRQATQLDPQDNIILSALIYQYGSGIEARRKNDDTVFSYRFLPSKEYGLYSRNEAWNRFWIKCYKLSKKFDTILYCDISDFYNQIYHHTVENQLAESGFSNQAIKWIIKLLESTTAGVSRGVPIGPHGIHLIAESTLIPIDNSLSAKGITFCRYADDIILFCKSRVEARSFLSILATTLDTQQRLTLQRHKTKFYNKNNFSDLCHNMIEDRPINPDEDKILKIVKKYSNGDPYQVISYNQISEEDWKQIDTRIIKKIINEYLCQQNVDYIRLRWFYRRLSQIGHIGAIQISLDKFEELGPCLATICSYIASIEIFEENQWKEVGEDLLNLLDQNEIAQNEYFRLSILSLFTKNTHINHISKLIRKYPSSEQFVRREIILAASINDEIDWLRELKESFQSMDSWQKTAYIYSLRSFPKDERKYFINNQTITRPFEQFLAKKVK